MSFIMDALKKADRERQQKGPVSPLTNDPQPEEVAEEAPRRRRRGGGVVKLLLFLTVVGGLGYGGYSEQERLLAFFEVTKPAPAILARRPTPTRKEGGGKPPVSYVAKRDTPPPETPAPPPTAVVAPPVATAAPVIAPVATPKPVLPMVKAEPAATVAPAPPAPTPPAPVVVAPPTTPTPPPLAVVKQPTPTAKGSSPLAKVAGVHYGCVIEVRYEDSAIKRFHLGGVGCAESDNTFGKRVRRALAAMVFTKAVRIERIGTEVDGQPSWEVFDPDNSSVNAAMVRAGLAMAMDPRYMEMEAQARQERQGMWADLPAPRR